MHNISTIYTNMTSLINAWMKPTFLEWLFSVMHVTVFVPHLQRTHRVYRQTSCLHLYHSSHPAHEWEQGHLKQKTRAAIWPLLSCQRHTHTAILERRWRRQGNTQDWTEPWYCCESLTALCLGSSIQYLEVTRVPLNCGAEGFLSRQC